MAAVLEKSPHTRRYINPVEDIGASLLNVEKPARYSGGEYGRLADKNAGFQMLIAFPDLYEIGMSNQALRILYNGLNALPGVSCDRAFAPAPDFERFLRDAKLPLYGLDTGISLKSLDALMFTLGYELGAGGILCMLDLSGIPLYSRDRDASDPLVIAGGPAVSNPLPYSDFIDAFWIGEAEAGFFELAAELSELKKSGKGRGALLEHTAAHPNIWVKGKQKALRAIDFHFGEKKNTGAVFPVASMKTVQHHGALEIMRGCPNGCRFCHAGFWYRPMRQKQQERIIEETAAFVEQGGYREISLSSLSSGDYSGIAELVGELNRRFRDRHVSFQMPSLKISGFSLSILEQVSQTRKSGLTFAVETPADAWQMSINKEVSRNSVVEILIEAKKHGWRGAKFYFMIGLPHSVSSDQESEETGIVSFIMDVARRTGMRFNINIGTFVPKPHTPYQWAAQIDQQTAFTKSMFIKNRLKPLGHKVSISEPVFPRIEGVISRGDERAGVLIEEAYRRGSRLDAWSEYVDKDIWENILTNNQETVDDLLAEKDPAAPLPWQGISSGVSINYLREQWNKSKSQELTSPCNINCTEPCGICSTSQKIVKNSIHSKANSMEKDAENILPVSKTDPFVWRILFSFTKHASAVFQSHLGLLEIFSMAVNRAGLPVVYTKGFNPLIKLEIASPLSLGISAKAEIAALDFEEYVDADTFIALLNKNLPEGIRIGQAEIFNIPGGAKKHSLASLLWGFCYEGANGGEYTQFAEEKRYRQAMETSAFCMTRNSVLAKNIIEEDTKGRGLPEWISYFDAYSYLYPMKKEV